MAREYQVRIWDFDPANYAPRKVVAQLNWVKNIGYGGYLNDISECFFTVNQDDPMIAKIVDPTTTDGSGLYRHVQILRDGATVWQGWLGNWDATATDVVFHAYGYISLLFLQVTKWNRNWQNTDLGKIIEELWDGASSATDSLLSWVTKGTIQNPVTTSGGSTAINMPQYRLYYQPVLNAIKALASLAVSDTTNVVQFYIGLDPNPASPTGCSFELRKNLTTHRTKIVLTYGDGLVRDFRERNLLAYQRNAVRAVASGPHGQLLRSEQNITSGFLKTSAVGVRAAPLFFSWVRNQADLDRAAKRRMRRASRAQVELTLRLYPDKFTPPTLADPELRGADDLALGDTLDVAINRGITLISDSSYAPEKMMVSGFQTLFVGGHEYVNLMLQSPL